MKRALRYLLLAVLLLVAGAAVVLYRWTHTPYGRLDPGAAVVSKLASWSPRPARPYSPEHRAQLNAQAGGYAPKYEGGDLAQRDVGIPAPWGVVRVRIYTPRGRGPFPAVLNVHGGGFFMGDGYVLDATVQELASRADLVAVSVDYRLAPEHPFPAALEDSYRALEWLHENAAVLNVDRGRVGVMGASAGGNIAAALTLMWRDRGGAPLAFQYLSVPSTDISERTHWRSFDEMGDEYSLRVTGIREMQDIYAPGAGTKLNAYASPLLAETHRGLPPALIVVAQFDPLRDQGIAYAKALERDGVVVSLRVVPGALHGFVGSPARARENMNVAVEWLRGTLGGSK